MMECKQSLRNPTRIMLQRGEADFSVPNTGQARNLQVQSRMEGDTLLLTPIDAFYIMAKES